MPALHNALSRTFASDNYSGVHPDVLAAIGDANGGHVAAYADDAYSNKLQEMFRAELGDDAEVFTVFNGTGANTVGLQSMLPRWGAVICSDTAHINVDECGAPEKVGGIKLLPVPVGPDGKLTPDLIATQAHGFGFVHHAQPLVVSITQSTERGTVYTPDEILAITDYAHSNGMLVHLDGARIANAAAALDLPLRACTSDVGIDVMSFGGTKNGAMLAEAVIVLNPAAAQGMDYLRKMNMQLASKARFLAAQLIALLENDLWLRNARHANAMATRIRTDIESGIADGSIRGVSFTAATEANGLFLTLPPGVADTIRSRYPFYDWEENEVRWLCSFDTTEQDADALVTLLKECT